MSYQMLLIPTILFSLAFQKTNILENILLWARDIGSSHKDDIVIIIVGGGLENI